MQNQDQTRQLKDTALYQDAARALEELKTMGASEGALKPIAKILLHTADLEAPASRFPFTGDPTDPRDRAVMDAYNQAWRRFVTGEDYDEEGEEWIGGY